MNHLISNSSHLKLAAAALATVALTVTVAACGDDDSSEGDAEKWRIGLEAPLSGDLQTLGEGMLNGAELAADQINDDGGLEGREIEIVPIDDGGDAEIGVPAAEEAIDRYGPNERRQSTGLQAAALRQRHEPEAHRPSPSYDAPDRGRSPGIGI